MNRENIFITIGVIILVVFIIWQIKYNKEHPCISYHTETQYEQPLSVVAGGSKYGGGIAIPMGNIKPVQVEVCDIYK